VGQEADGIAQGVRGSPTLPERLEVRQITEGMTRAELSLSVARVDEELTAGRESLGRSEARGAQGGGGLQRIQGASTENTDDTSPRARATAGISTTVVTLYEPSAASGGIVNRYSLE
jgi:hypothetical protein